MLRLAVFVLAAATLCLETALTHVFALSHGHHFAFMAISIALLGLGAGGTLVALVRSHPSSSLWRDAYQDRLLVLGALGMAVTTVIGCVLINRVPFDIYQVAWQRVQLLYLAMNYLALTLPFVFVGWTLSLLLETVERGPVVYAANLLGSAAGCLLALGALARFGGSGAIAVSAAGGSVAAGLFVCHGSNRSGWQRMMLLLATSLGALALLAIAWGHPDWFEVRLSPYRSLSQALLHPQANVLSSRWNAFSRVDVVESGAVHVSPGLSLGYTGQLPPQRGLYVDAQAQAAIVRADPVSVRDWADQLPLSLAYHLSTSGDVLVLEPGGGIDVAVARSQGAERVISVSSNPLVVDAVQQYGEGLYSDPHIEVFVQSPRSFVRSRVKGMAQFDVIDLALHTAQHTVVSGGYTLSEDYRYTVQAFADYWALLRPQGYLVVQRWLQTPPSESLRAWGLVVATLEQAGVSDPPNCLIAIRSWSTMLILAKKGPLVASELEMVRRFCAERQFDLVYLPGVQPGEINRYNVFPGAPYASLFHDLLDGTSRERFYREQAYDVRPPSDERPFFFHFFKWRQVPEIWHALGRTWQPFGGAGYLVLLALLGIAVLASGALILLPLAFAKSSLGSLSARSCALFLAYAGCLGVAYLSVEIPLIQRFALFVDHPTIAFATIVTVLLVSSGVGSLLASRLRAWLGIPLLVVYLLLLYTSMSFVLEFFLDRSLGVRVFVSFVLVAPLGLLMGTPFATLLLLLRRDAPSLIPWAWAVNGCASVVASISSALIALSWGFDVVLGIAAAIYIVAWGILIRYR